MTAIFRGLSDTAKCLVCFDDFVLFGSDADKRSAAVVYGPPTFPDPSNPPVHPARYLNAVPSFCRVNMDETPAPYKSGGTKVIGSIGSPVHVSEAKGVNTKRMATLMVAAAPPDKLKVMAIFHGGESC